MKRKIGIVVLAAGEGTRLKLSTPKPVIPLVGRKLMDFPVKEGLNFLQKNDFNGHLCAVVGHGRDQVMKHLAKEYAVCGGVVSSVIQEVQRGTADAVRSYINGHPASREMDYTIVLCADTPLIRLFHLETLFHLLEKENLDGVAATFKIEDPTGYGRIVRSPGRGTGFKIVEQKDAGLDELKINEVNSGLYIIKTQYLLENLERINCQNKAGEFYLTDLFQEDGNVRPVNFEDGSVFLGVNTLEQLEVVEQTLFQEKRRTLQKQGVRFIDRKSCYIDYDVKIESDVTIFPNAMIEGKCSIGKGCYIGIGSCLKDTIIEENATIKAYSHLEGTVIHKEAVIGPFARLRPGANIGEKSKIGNFVEIKKSVLEKGVKVSHLSYVGDAEIGEETNIGCGFITCNYDGAKKHLTKIGRETFVGSDSQTVAPVEIGDRCFIASGSTINKNVPDDSFAISRSRQSTKVGIASRFIKKK